MCPKKNRPFWDIILGLIIIVTVAVIISKNSNNKPNESEELDAE